MTIYIVIPACNEAANILSTIEGINQQLTKTSFMFKIIIVDDGSKDKTVSQVLGLDQQNRICLIQNHRRLGVAKAIYNGLKQALDFSKDNDDAVLVMEADGTSDPMLIPDMITTLNNNDIVIASRFVGKGGMRGYSSLRTICTKSLNRLLRILVPINAVTDYSIFYRAYRINILQKAFTDYGKSLLTFPGFEANTELLLKLLDYNIRLKELPLIYDYSLKKSKSKMPILKTIYGYLILVLKTKMQSYTIRKCDK